MKQLFSIVVFVDVIIGFAALSTASAGTIYYPHVASDGSWETEIGIINNDSNASSGTLYAYNGSGGVVENLSVSLVAGERKQFVVGTDFSDPANIAYMKLVTDKECYGYEKFYQNGQRVAIPAVTKLNSSQIFISHIASDVDWWTGLALVNTNNTAVNIVISFDDGSSYNTTLAAGAHWSSTIASLPGINAAQVNSAVINNAGGVIGLELFGSNAGSGKNYLSGILLRDETTRVLYYPHVVSDSTWWTGIVAYNPAASSTSITVTPYTSSGSSLTATTLVIPASGKYLGTISSLNLPATTAWFKLEAEAPVSGFELFGTDNGRQLGGYSTVNIQTKNGIFAKIEKNGWTGIAFVNVEAADATITLTAIDNNGNTIASSNTTLVGHGKQLGLAPELFNGDISSASYIRYSSDRYIVGFQLNGSSDETMLDALPGLSSLQDFSANITDSNLRNCVNAVGLPYWEITTLSCSSMGIQSLDGLENFAALKNLTVDDNPISSITPLTNLSLLEKVNFNSSQVTEVTALNNHTSLVELHLYNNQISDFSPLRNLANLRTFDCGDNLLRSTPLIQELTQYFTRITSLGINRIGNADLSWLSNFNNLYALRAGDNDISDLGPLSTMTGLQQLRLNNNNISDISTLQNLSALQELWIFKNSITDLTPLSGLTNLQTLDCSYNNITDFTPVEHVPNLTTQPQN